MYRDIPEELRILIEPVVEDAGLELVDVSLARGGRTWSLRVTVDTPSGDGRVPVDLCARVSREIGTRLDVADAIESAYQLEVSSPGLDRMLSREKDFANACGSEVQVETRTPIAGRRRFRGVLRAFDDDVASIEVDGRASAVPFAQIAKANRIYQFTAADFRDARREPGRESRRTGSASGESGNGKTAGRTGGRTAGR